MRASIAAMLVLALSFFSGCVYYNTFYHARSSAREAALLREERSPDEAPGPREKELLDRVVEKCGRVLQLHPDSDWADDALLLLGTTHYYQGRYESAERRLTEFVSRYPDSGLRPEAEYMLAKVLIARGNPVSAESLLEPLAYADPPVELSDDALALIGQARHDRKKYAEAVEAYVEALERFPKSDRRADIRFRAAENYEAMGDLDGAARQYELVTSERGSRSLAFEARMRLVDIDLTRGRAAEALEVLGELERRTDERDDLDRVLLLKGKAFEQLGRPEDAVETYEGISAAHKRSEASGEAQYRIGVIQRDDYELYDEAKLSFRKARDEAPRTDVADRAAAAAADIETLLGYLDTIRSYEAARAVEGAVESGGAPADSAGASGADSSPVASDGVADTLSYAVADTAHTAVADTLSSAVADTAGAALADTFSTVVPDTSAQAAAAEDERRRAVAVARLRAAEVYLFRFGDPARARAYYEAVLEDHPASPQAPKAALALAWLLDDKLGDRDAARLAYERVLVEYADTEYAEAAADSLESLRGTKEREAP